MKKLLGVFFGMIVTVMVLPAQQTIKVSSNAPIYEPLIKAIYTEIGLTPEFVNLPLERALISVNEGSADADMFRAAGDMTIYPNIVQTKEPLFSTNTLAIVRKDFEASEVSVADLKKYTIGYLRGVKVLEKLAEGSVKSYAADSSDSLTKMLRAKRFDVFLLTGDPTIILAQNADFKVLEKPVLVTNLVHNFNKKWAAYIPQFDAVLKAMKADGRYKKLTTGS